MNDEIKEILDDLRTYKDRYEYYLFNNLSFNGRDYKAKILLDYITNLQQENERLKWDKEQLNSLVNSCQEEIRKLKEEKESWQRVATKNFNNVEDYKSRIEKAVEYIKEHIRIDDEYPDYMEMLIEEKDKLLNILNDRSDE